MIIAQITDTHILTPNADDPKIVSRAISRADNLRAVVTDINALSPAPDAIIHTGDMVQTRAPEEYHLAREIMSRLSAPLYVVPGNRDSRQGLRQNFGSDGYLTGNGEDEPVLYSIESHAVRLIGFDSLSGTSPLGDVDEARLTWLDETLAQAPEAPTAIIMHHPPVTITVSVKPWQYQRAEAGDELACVIAKHPQVARLFCGHIHRAFVASFGGTQAGSVPSIAADLRKGDYPPHLSERPIYQIHRFQPDGYFSSETHIVGMQTS